MKIVIIGGGFAGLVATYKLCNSHNVVIVEKDSYLGDMFSPLNYPERSMNGSIVAGFECAYAVQKEQNE